MTITFFASCGTEANMELKGKEVKYNLLNTPVFIHVGIAKTLIFASTFIITFILKSIIGERYVEKQKAQRV